MSVVRVLVCAEKCHLVAIVVILNYGIYTSREYLIRHCIYLTRY